MSMSARSVLILAAAAALVLVCIGIFLVNRAPQTQETKA